MNIKELRNKLQKKKAILHSNVYIEWSINIFSFKINYLCISDSDRENSLILKMKKGQYFVYNTLRSTKREIAIFDTFFDPSAESKACELFYNIIIHGHWLEIYTSLPPLHKDVEKQYTLQY
jgi:hypothetical protein